MTEAQLGGYLKSLSPTELDNLKALVAMNSMESLVVLQEQAVESGNVAAVQYMEAACDLRRIADLPTS